MTLWFEANMKVTLHAKDRQTNPNQTYKNYLIYQLGALQNLHSDGELTGNALSS